MANSGGHWKTLAEAQKQTQSTKIPGVFEEDIKRNNPLDMIPVAQASGTGLKIEWLQEKTDITDDVVEAAPGDQLSWDEDVEYTEVESTLRYFYLQRKLDKYVQSIYGTYNDYKNQVLAEMEKALKRKVGDRLIYGDTTYGGSPTQFDGLHALAAEHGATPGTGYNVNLNIDENGALSLNNLRNMVSAMKYGCDVILVPTCIGIRLDALYEEQGIASYAGPMYLTRTIDQVGQPLLRWSGIPIIRTDYLVLETDGTGTGASSDARAKSSSGTTYSIFGLKFGNVMERQPGICYAYGSDNKTSGYQQGDFYELWPFDMLEDYNAGGFRVNHYGTVLLGSTICLGRIFDITDAAITA